MEEGKAYIESGILELYVLGQLSAPQQEEVQAMAAQYPEIKQEIDAIELVMEQYAMQHAVRPAEGLEDKILKSITENTSPRIGSLRTDTSRTRCGLSTSRSRAVRKSGYFKASSRRCLLNNCKERTMTTTITAQTANPFHTDSFAMDALLPL